MGLFDLFSRKARGVSSDSTDPNFSSSIQMWTPGQPIYSDKNYASYVRNGYRRNAALYACINKISSAAAGIEWKLYKDREMKVTIDSHPLLDLWRNPNPRMSGSGMFMESMFGYWHMAGNSYIWSFRPAPNMPPSALWLLRPDRVKAVASTTGVQGYIYGYGSSNPIVYDLPEIAHIKFVGYDDDIYGLSPIEVASYPADQQNEAQGWNTSLMQNAGRPASVFMSKSYLTVEQRNQIKEELRRRYSGKRNAGMPLILEADMTWQNMSLTPMELDWLKSRELNTREIAAIFDVAPELIGDSAGKTFANVSEARQALYLENVLPKLDRVRGYINSWLVPMYSDLAGNGAYFSYDPKDIEALQAIYQQAQTALENRANKLWAGGIATLNEAREKVGLEPIKTGGECLRIGAVLVSIDSLEEYADQSLQAPAAPPMPQPEPLIAPPATQLQLPAGKKPGVTQVDESSKAHKDMDALGIYQPNNLDTQLAALRAKDVQYVTWKTDVDPCETCSINDMQTVKLGDRFNSGHILPPVHRYCECEVVPALEPNKTSYDLLLKALIIYMRNKGYIYHEENSVQDNNQQGGASNTDIVGATVQLRSLPVPEEKAEIQQGNDGIQDSGKISGDAYRAFLERYI